MKNSIRYPAWVRKHYSAMLYGWLGFLCARYAWMVHADEPLHWYEAISSTFFIAVLAWTESTEIRFTYKNWKLGLTWRQAVALNRKINANVRAGIPASPAETRRLLEEVLKENPR